MEFKVRNARVRHIQLIITLKAAKILASCGHEDKLCTNVKGHHRSHGQSSIRDPIICYLELPVVHALISRFAVRSVDAKLTTLYRFQV